MLASLMFDAVMSTPREQRQKPVSAVCTDMRLEIRAIAEMVEGTFDGKVTVLAASRPHASGRIFAGT